jgi:alanyl aminopeptidase
LPPEWQAYFAWVGSDVCDPRQRRQVREFFGPRLAGVDGGPQSLAQALEVVDQCIAQRAYHAEGLAAELRHAAATP